MKWDYKDKTIIGLQHSITGTENVVSISCPIKGEYNGVLPDAPQFCAKMSSDCNNPNIMFYSVSRCSETSGIYDGKPMF